MRLRNNKKWHIAQLKAFDFFSQNSLVMALSVCTVQHMRCFWYIFQVDFFSALDSFKNTYCQHVRPSISFLCSHKIFICLFYSLSNTPSWSEYKQQAQKKRPTGIPLSNYKLCGLCHIFFSFSLFPIEWSECSVIRLCGSFILHTFNNELKIKPFPWPIWNSISPIHSRNDSAHMSHFPLADARIWGKSILILIFIQEENEAINRANPPHFNEHNICGFFFIFLIDRHPFEVVLLIWRVSM